MIFKFCFLIFAIVCFIQRICEIVYHKHIKGTTKASWITKGIITSHLFFFFGSLAELFFYKHNIIYWISVVGLILFLSGVFLRRAAIKALGPLWSIEIEMRIDHALITAGPYAFCRHPNYLAILLEVVGFCLVPNAFYTLVIALMMYTPLLILRIRTEEAELLARFGDRYLTYAKVTPLIVPNFKELLRI